MTSGGYGVDTAELTSAGEHVQMQAADRMGPPLKAVGDIDVAAQDFGPEHTHHFQQYTAGIDRLVAMVKGYVDVSRDFGGRLGGASSTYQSVESQTEQSMQHERNALGGE